MVNLTSPTRDAVTDRDKSHAVTPSPDRPGERDGRDTHPIGGVTLSRPPVAADLTPQVLPFDVITEGEAGGEKLSVNFNFRMTHEQAETLAAVASSLAVDRGKIVRWAIEHAAEVVADGWYLERLGATPPTIESLTVHLRRLMVAEAMASRVGERAA